MRTFESASNREVLSHPFLFRLATGAALALLFSGGPNCYADPFNIAPDGQAFMGLSDSLSGAGDQLNLHFLSGDYSELTDEVYTKASNFTFNIGTDNGIDNFKDAVVTDDPVNDFAGVLWSAPQDGVTSLQLQHYLAVDGGWFGPLDVIGGGVPLTGADLAAPEVQVTSNGGGSWTTIATSNSYVADHTGVPRGSGFATSTIGPLTTFTFDAQNGINGIRVIGDAGGSGDGNGFTAYTELKVLQETGQVFPTLDITTATGEMAFVTDSGTPLEIMGYTIRSGAGVGAIDSSGWVSVSNTYDASGTPGPSQIDAVNEWSELPGADTTILLSEAVLTGNSVGGSLASGLNLSLGTLWSQNPSEEDIEVEILLADGRQRRIEVTYNGGLADNPVELGDLNFDGALSPADWPILRDNFNTDLQSLTPAQAYGFGDLNFDGFNNELDFSLFKSVYDDALGVGAFASMLAGSPAPEPASLLLATAMLSSALFKRRVRVV